MTDTAPLPRYDALIVGGGHAGAQAAIQLRQLGFEGTVGMLGAEPDIPYERPPLSKEYLAGERGWDRMPIRSAAFWAERRVDVLTGRTVTALDPEARTAACADGEAIGYGALVWAAGGRARRLSCEGGDLAGVHTVRDRADADQLKAELPDARHAVVIGGGYVGLEAAAALAKQGKRVTVLEAAPRVLMRVAGEALSRFYEDAHRRHGAEVVTGAAVTTIGGRNGRAAEVALADGRTLPADLVIVGVGIDPEVGPLLAAGAAGPGGAPGGVLVDERCRTSLPDVYAAGDCAAHNNAYAGGAVVRVESVQNANDQATVAAAGVAGQERTYGAVPWFWSNQYDLKLQTVGLSGGHDRAVVRGDPASGRFSVVYLREGRVAAVDAVNAVRDYVQGRKLVEGRVEADPARLADSDVPLAALAG